jgi:hypothetical protein
MDQLQISSSAMQNAPSLLKESSPNNVPQVVGYPTPHLHHQPPIISNEAITFSIIPSFCTPTPQNNQFFNKAEVRPSHWPS